MKNGIGVMLRSWFMSIVVTRLVKPPAVRLTERTVPTSETIRVPTRHGSVRCLITRPAPDAPLAAGGALPPVTLHIHGGGFVVGNPRQDEHLVRGIAGEVGSVVVNIDYSTSPGARFPRALEECFDVLRWIERSAAAMGWDATRIAVSGGSAGANLALGSLALAGRHGGPAVRAAVLLVPAVDLTIAPQDVTSPIDKPFVNAGLLEMVDASYFTKGADRSDPLVSPIFLGDELGAFPPLLVLTAEYDTFLPYIDRFADRARSFGVTVDQHRFDGVDHDFYFAGGTPARTFVHLMTLIRDHLLTELGTGEDE